MKHASKVLVLLAMLVLLSFSVSAASGVNALTGKTEAITESAAKSVNMLNIKDNGILCVNCPSLTSAQAVDKTALSQLSCTGKDTCVIYTGFKLKEVVPKDEWATKAKGIEYSVPNPQDYAQDSPIRDDKNNLQAGKSMIADDALIQDKENFKIYSWPSRYVHTLRITNANVIISETGEISLTGLNTDKEKVPIEWIDKLGIPLNRGDHIISFVGDASSKGNDIVGDLSIPELFIGDIYFDIDISAQNWLKSLPDNLKDKEQERPEITLCGQKFTNYFRGSEFIIKMSEDMKSCEIPYYKLNTVMSVEDDVKNWKEYEYKCGDLSFQAIGGNIKGLACDQETGKRKHFYVGCTQMMMDFPKSEREEASDFCRDNKGPKLWYAEKSSENSLKLRLKINDYWLSFDKDSELKSIIPGGSVSITANQLRVSQDIPNTGGPLRYKGDSISTDGTKPILFLLPTDKGYTATKAFQNEPQILANSEAGLEITREFEKSGKAFWYNFIPPHAEYVLQLGSIKYPMQPIIAIYPKGTKDSILSGESTAEGMMIQVIGAFETNILALGKETGQIDVSAMSPKKESSKVKIEEETVTSTDERALEDFVAKECFAKDKYSLLDKDEAKVADPIIDLIVDANFKIVQDRKSKIKAGTKINWPGGAKEYESNGKRIRIEMTNGCKKVKENAVKKVARPASKQKCIDIGPGAYCTEKEKCATPMNTIFGNEFATAKSTWWHECPPTQICCMTTKQERALLSKESKLEGNSACAKSGGKCFDEGMQMCINMKTKHQLLSGTGCFSRSGNDACCPKEGTVTSMFEVAGDEKCAILGGHCADTKQYNCAGGNWKKDQCLSDKSKDYLCCVGGKLETALTTALKTEGGKLVDSYKKILKNMEKDGNCLLSKQLGGLGGQCASTSIYDCEGAEYVAGKCLSNWAADYQCCPAPGKLVDNAVPLAPLVPITTACSQVCSEILGDDTKQKCTKAANEMRAANCDTSCQYITGMGCTKIRRCASGSASGCVYTLDEVGGKTCDIPTGSKDNKCILRSV